MLAEAFLAAVAAATADSPALTSYWSRTTSLLPRPHPDVEPFTPPAFSFSRATQRALSLAFDRRESELSLQLREAESRCADQARRKERAEREATELRENSKKIRQALEAGEKETRGLRWELEDRQQIAAAEVRVSTIVIFVFETICREQFRRRAGQKSRLNWRIYDFASNSARFVSTKLDFMRKQSTRPTTISIRGDKLWITIPAFINA